jgi:hypothetical protein
MGLIDRFQDLPGKKTFFFRVRTPKGYTFDSAQPNYATLTEAHAAMMRAYPGAKLSVLEEREFDPDGLPKLKTTVTREPLTTQHV